MTAYYNEIDPFAAEWLRMLINEGHIAPGEVDESDIRDIKPNELSRYTQCHFFAGIGVWSYALRQAGWPDDRPVWTGSCPCQPHSGAASDRARGFTDERDLWPVWFDLIKERAACPVFSEQTSDSAAWINRAKTDLEETNYIVAFIDFPACAVNAPIERMRTYFVAVPDSSGLCEQSRAVPVAPQHITAKCSSGGTFYGDHRTTGEFGRVRRIEPGVRLLAHVSPARVGRLRGYGNAIVAEQAKAFIESYMAVGAVAE